MTIVDVTKDNECCCSCIHNKRTFIKDYYCTCTCELDGHYIGCVANFESVCDEWEGKQSMINTIITFFAGAWFGALVFMFTLALLRMAHDVDSDQ